MFLNHRLLDPDSDNQGGGDADANQNDSSLDGNLSDESSQQQTQKTEEATSPSAEQIANWERIEGEHKVLSSYAETLRENGITSAEALNTQLAYVKKINSNEQIKNAVSALISTPDQKADNADASRGTGLGVDEVGKLVQEQLLQYHKTEADKQRLAGQGVENDLLNQIIGHKSLKGFIDGKNTAALWDNKGSKAGRAISIIADDLLVQRSGRDPDTGALLPVTDRAVVEAVQTELSDILKEIKLQTIMELSTEAEGIETPDSPAQQEDSSFSMDKEFDKPLFDTV